MLLTDNLPDLEQEWAAVLQPILQAARESHAACRSATDKRAWIHRVMHEVTAALPADVAVSIDWASQLLWVRQDVNDTQRTLILPVTGAAEAYYSAGATVRRAVAPFLDELPKGPDNEQ